MFSTDVLVIISAILIMLFAFVVMPVHTSIQSPRQPDTRTELPGWLLFNRERENMTGEEEETGPEPVEHFEDPDSNVQVLPSLDVPNIDVSSTLGTTPTAVNGLLSSQSRAGSSSVGELIPGK
jgi:hypothetical protein